MRAVAVGMAATEGLPICPRDCGGRIGGEFPELLTESQRGLREMNGCDKAAAHARYTITCPRCEGTKILPNGTLCDQCESTGRMRGEKKLFRCPASHMTNEISDGLRHYAHAEAGIFPNGEGLMSQSTSYIQFVGVLGAEMAKVRRQESEDRRSK